MLGWEKVLRQQSRLSVWRSGAFRAYLGSTGFSGMALAMQQLLLSWILVAYQTAC